MEDQVKLIKQAYNDVKLGKLSEGSFIFVVGMILELATITDEDLEWADKYLRGE